MLSDRERNLVRQLWARGPSVLVDEGYSPDAVRLFLGRRDVASELALLDEEFKHSKTIQARTRYVSERNLARLADGAAAVLANAMAGPQYLRNPETGAILSDARGNPILRAAETSTNQIRAAKTVFDALGLGERNIIEHHGDLQLHVLVEAHTEAPEITYDPGMATEEERALSRERVRNVIEQLSARLPEIKGRVNETLGLSAPTRKKVAKKKVTKTTKTAAGKSLKKKVTARGRKS